MMEDLLPRVRKLAAAELKSSCERYEKRFASRDEAALILGEELNETELELTIAKRYMAMFDRGVVSPGHLEEMEDRMLNAACEAIQTAAMCRKWILSMTAGDATQAAQVQNDG